MNKICQFLGERLLLIGIFVAVLGWFVISVTDVVLFSQGTIVERLLPLLDGHEMSMRATFVVSIIGFSVYTSFVLSALKKAGEELQMAKQRLHTVVNNAPIAILAWDSQGGFILSEGKSSQYFGLQPEANFGVSARDLLGSLAVVQESGVATNGESVVHRVLSGESMKGITQLQGAYFENHFVPMRDSNAQVIGLVDIAVDITEQKQAEEALREAEMQYRILFEKAPAGIVVIDKETALPIEFNDMVCRQLGYTRDEFAGLRIFDYEAVEMQDETKAHIERIRREGHDKFETRHCTKTGEVRNVIVTMVAVELSGRSCFNCIFLDITEQKQAEEVLRASEEKYRLLVENIPDVIWTADQSRNTVFLGANYASVEGFTPEEIYGGGAEAWFGRIHPDHVQVVEVAFESLINKGKMFDVEYRIQRKDGEWVWLHDRAVAVYQKDGVKYAQGIFSNITERKRAEEKLGISRVLNRNLVEHLPRRIFIKDRESKYVLCNAKFAEDLGITPEQIMGKDDFAFFPTEVAEGYREEECTVMETGVIKDIEECYQIAGKGMWVHTVKIPYYDEHGRVDGVLGMFEDITERKQAIEATEHRLAELEAVNHISRVLRTGQTLDEMLPTLLDVTLEVLHITAGSIWLYDPAKDELRSMASRARGEKDMEWPQPQVYKPGQGAAGYVFATGESLMIRESRLEPHLSEAIRQTMSPGIGEAIVPIRAGENVIGVFGLRVPLPREVTTSEVQLLTTICEIAGNAIQRTILHQQTERHLRHLGALADIDRAITSGFDLHLNLATVLNQVSLQLGVDAADVLLFSSSSQALEYVAGRGFRTKAIERACQGLAEGYAGRAALERHIIHIQNLAEEKDTFLRGNLLGNEGFVSYYAVPLIAKGQIKGVLELFHRALFELDEELLDFLNSLARQAAIAIDNVMLFESLERSNFELVQAYDSNIEGWSRALDLRDKETEGHSKRVTELTMRLARFLKVSESELVQIRRGALLHDIGKMGVSDAILLKPEPLSEEEWVSMRKHPIHAYEMLAPITYLRSAIDIAYCHQEKWDGTGYPRGLKAESIPLAARIFAVVDVYDALRSDRPYRPAWSEEKAREQIISLSGTHFDPKVVEAFLLLDPL